MNKRIQELYKQSFIEVQDENSFPCMTFSKQKFAELIVKECVMLCDKVYEQNDNVKIQAGATFCREDIKEHFGVNE